MFIVKFLFLTKDITSLLECERNHIHVIAVWYSCRLFFCDHSLYALYATFAKVTCCFVWMWNLVSHAPSKEHRL